MANPLPETNWPNRPEYPFRFFDEWNGATVVAESGKEPQSWAFCITSMHLASQAVAVYFSLIFERGSGAEEIATVMVEPTSTLSMSLPTPFVVAESESWRLVAT